MDILDIATGAGPCVEKNTHETCAEKNCHETCATCLDSQEKDKCLTCRDLGSAGTLTLLNGECRCQDGTYYIEGKLTCAACHEDCSMCSGPSSNECFVCEDGTKRLQKAENSSVGSCIALYDDNGNLKEEFKDDVETLKVNNKKAPGFELPTPKNFKAAKRPKRLPPKGFKRKVPIRLSRKLSRSIQRLGTCFSPDAMMTIKVDGLVRGKGFTFKASLSQDKLSLDIDFKILNKRKLFVIARFVIKTANYFFRLLKKLPGSTCRKRILQEFSSANQDLVDNTPLMSNETFSAQFLAHDYNENAVDSMKSYGGIFMVVYYLAVFSAFVLMLALICKSKTFTVVKFLEFLFAVQWVVKIAYIRAAWSLGELVFIDELARADTVLMAPFAEERGVRSRLGTESSLVDYSIPVLVINSGATCLCLALGSLMVVGVIQLVTGSRENYVREENEVTEFKGKNGSGKDVLQFSRAGSHSSEKKSLDKLEDREKEINRRDKLEKKEVGLFGRNTQNKMQGLKNGLPQSSSRHQPQGFGVGRQPAQSTERMGLSQQQQPKPIRWMISSRQPAISSKKLEKVTKKSKNFTTGDNSLMRLQSVCLSLSAPNLVFYSLINAFWISFSSNPKQGWVFISLGVSVIILILSALLYVKALDVPPITKFSEKVSITTKFRPKMEETLSILHPPSTRLGGL